jgi:hypothetical protein
LAATPSPSSCSGLARFSASTSPSARTRSRVRSQRRKPQEPAPRSRPLLRQGARLRARQSAWLCLSASAATRQRRPSTEWRRGQQGGRAGSNGRGFVPTLWCGLVVGEDAPRADRRARTLLSNHPERD